MTAETEDKELVEFFLQTREEGIFRIIYRRHTPRLYMFAMRLTAGNHHDAEDMLQETWIRAVRNLGKFSWRSTLNRWLSGIVVNCFREMKKARKNDPGFMPAEPLFQDNSEQSLDLELSIRQLPDGCREVFLLHDLEGYTHEEIGNLLNIHPGTSKSQLFEARSKLRLWLGREEGEAR